MCFDMCSNWFRDSNSHILADEGSIVEARGTFRRPLRKYITWDRDDDVLSLDLYVYSLVQIEQHV